MYDGCRQPGFTLVELAITLALVGILAAVGLPLYRDYIATARVTLLRDNIHAIRLMQDSRRMDRGEYVEGVYDPVDNDTSLVANLGWRPAGAPPAVGEVSITYAVACDASAVASAAAARGECTRRSGYTVTATHIDAPSKPVVMTFQP